MPDLKKLTVLQNLKTSAVAAAVALVTSGAFAAETPNVNFLIPGGAGGGWDTTASAVGSTLEATDLASVSNYENFTGGGGGRALASFAAEAGKYDGTLMVQSTPLIMRALSGVYKNDWRDTKPVAIMISAYQAIAVPADSEYQTLEQLIADMRNNPKDMVVAGGSGRLSLDHVTLGLIAQASGIDLDSLRYSPAEGGGEALDRMLDGGQVKAVVSGVGELLAAAEAGKIRILGVSSEAPLSGLDYPTFKSQGVDVVFSNWRGFFAAPSTSDADVAAYEQMLVDLSQTGEWAETRATNKWEPLVIVGDELDAFLASQEAALGDILSKLQ
jgi:putative tricarboxylic transport membrane protein